MLLPPPLVPMLMLPLPLPMRSSQAERSELGIRTRWDINSTNETFAETVLRPLVHSTAETVVEVPFFQKALDERHSCPGPLGAVKRLSVPQWFPM